MLGDQVMGYTRKVLKKVDIDPAPTFYSSSFRIDLGESFHLHYRNKRLEFSPSEFDKVSRGFFWARVRYLLTGKVTIRPEEHIIKFWDDSTLTEETGADYPSVRGSELSVELQEQTDYIHLHYQGSRLEFSIAEFQEFANVIQEANVQLLADETIESAPRRIGKNHKIQPDNRVDDRKNIGEYLTGNTLLSEKHEYTRKSVIKDEETDTFVSQIDDSPTIVQYPSKLYLIFFLPYVVLHISGKLFNRTTIEKTLIKYLKDWIRS